MGRHPPTRPGCHFPAGLGAFCLLFPDVVHRAARPPVGRASPMDRPIVCRCLRALVPAARNPFRSSRLASQTRSAPGTIRCIRNRFASTGHAASSSFTTTPISVEACSARSPTLQPLSDQWRVDGGGSLSGPLGPVTPEPPHQRVGVSGCLLASEPVVPGHALP